MEITPASLFGFQYPAWDIKANILLAIPLGLPVILVYVMHVHNPVLDWLVFASWTAYGLKNLVVTYLFFKYLLYRNLPKKGR